MYSIVSTYLSFLLLGLANGATYAALGLALVVTYRNSKVMNLAVSAIALFTATIYAGLRNGQVPMLLPGLPQRVARGRLPAGDRLRASGTRARPRHAG